MKKMSALVLAGGLTASLIVAPQATTAPSGSSGSSKPTPVITPTVTPPKQPPLGSAYTGSAPVSLTIAALLTLLVGQVIVDAVPPLRAAVDDLARQAGFSGVMGSSQGNRIFDFSKIDLNELQKMLPKV
ncbi:hypothetical protein [Corynebacterium pseudogenitalium]|uniref:hypothetical protein n=1 Tax=Corynebacterium pseudogenitalium TaxID=38303 RepID=UPI00210D9708|nr:hypothetical protein [Corynebacterium pseudogenitalium]UUA87294.1 hypothetical protein KBP54_00035 [Corynebacterium pseudogenitalium]